MVLQSQMPRDGANRRYVASARRRNKPRWPWAVVAAVALIVVIIVMNGGSSGEANGEQTNPDAAGAQAAGAGTAERNLPVPGHTASPTPTPARTPITATPAPSRTPEADSRLAAGGSRADGSLPVRPRADRRDTVTPRPAQPVPTPPAAVQQAPISDDIRIAFKQALQLREQGKLVESRAILNDMVHEAEAKLTAADMQNVRDIMAQINDTLIFSPTPYADDPLTEIYRVQSGDALSRIAPRYKIPYELIASVNQVDAGRIREGQKLKIVKGPFHAIVSKRDFRMDLYLEGPDGRHVYIRSYSVGLGEEGSTPVGTFKVGTKRGPENGGPSWTSPRTGERFAASDPLNPIGEAWIALTGIDGGTRELQSYGIHGTIEPDSIGQQRSMGCVRLLNKDVLQVFNMLTTEHSKVLIRP